MKHIVVAGPGRTDHHASWSSLTGELDGDPAIVDTAKRMATITTTVEDGERPINWRNASSAVPALMSAAQRVYGQPVDHFTVKEGGDTAVVPSSSAPTASA